MFMDFQILLQVILYNLPDLLHYILPGYVGGVCAGAVTPSGVQIKYQVNVLQAWSISNGNYLFFFFKVWALRLTKLWRIVFWALELAPFVKKYGVFG